MSWFSGRNNGKHAPADGRLPLARADELVVEEVGEELLIYDKTTNRAHCLGAIAAKVWRACDGYTNTAVLCTKLDLDSETVGQVLDELDGNSLLQDTPQIGHTRREMTVKAARVGAAAASVPFIYSMLAPSPAAATPPTFEECAHYSSAACGILNCAQICGCCCCCTGCDVGQGNSSCKICTPFDQCPSSPGGIPTLCTDNSKNNCSPGFCSVPGPGSCLQPCTPGIKGDECASFFGDPCTNGQ